MYTRLLSGLTIAAIFCWAGLAHAERADQNKPMNIESDALRYDDVRQVSVFTGNVVLTKGTILIRADRLEVRQDSAGYQYGLATGSADKPAFYRQKRDAVDEFIEGEGETINYDGRADVVTFSRQAVLRRFRGSTLADEITGAVIVYENLTETFSVDGAADKGPVGALGSKGRVRVMLTPKADPNAPAPGSEAIKLTPSATIGGAAK